MSRHRFLFGHAAGALLLGMQQAGNVRMATQAEVIASKVRVHKEMQKRPEGLPDSWPDRRVNFASLKTTFADTPGTRQQKRDVMIDMAKVMEGEAIREERSAKKLERKSRRRTKPKREEKVFPGSQREQPAFRV